MTLHLGREIAMRDYYTATSYRCQATRDLPCACRNRTVHVKSHGCLLTVLSTPA